MAADYAILGENLRHFYDFTNKIVLYVGAGGRQLLDPAGHNPKIGVEQYQVIRPADRQRIVAPGHYDYREFFLAPLSF